MKTQIESLWETLKSVNDWIKFSDTKALALLGFQVVFLGFILSKALGSQFREMNSPLTYLVLMAAFALNAGSITWTFKCLNPRLKMIGGVSPIYFGTISEKFKNSRQYRDFFKKNFSHEEDIEDELAGQVYMNSTIAWKKFRCVAYSLRFLVASLAFWAIYLLLIMMALQQNIWLNFGSGKISN